MMHKIGLVLLLLGAAVTLTGALFLLSSLILWGVSIFVVGAVSLYTVYRWGVPRQAKEKESKQNGH